MSELSKAPKGAVRDVPSPSLYSGRSPEVDDVFSQIGGVVGGWEDGQTETRGWDGSGAEWEWEEEEESR